MKRLVLTVAMICGGITVAQTEASTIRITEVLTAGVETTDGWVPPYVEVFVSSDRQGEPFDLVVVNTNLESVWAYGTTIEPSDWGVYVVHDDREGEWGPPMPGPDRRTGTHLDLGQAIGGSRSILLFDHVTGLGTLGGRFPDELYGQWVDKVSYYSVLTEEFIEPGWEEDTIEMDMGDAILRALNPGGGYIAGAVDDNLLFEDYDYRLKPGLMTDGTIDGNGDEGVIIPEPGTAGLLGVLLAAMATGRGRSRRRSSPASPGRAVYIGTR